MVNIKHEDLANGAKKFRKELLMMPVFALGPALDHMSLRTGIRYSETVGELSGDMQFGPYSDTRIDKSETTVNGRTLSTFFGSVVREFKPNSVYKSLYGSAITKGESLKTTDIVKRVLSYYAGRLGHNLYKNLWNAIRKDDGDTTKDLFNGFDTITATEIGSGAISKAKENLFEFTEPISVDNAVDQITAFCESANELLTEETNKLKLFCSPQIYRAYCKDYKQTTGAIPYNTAYGQKAVEGFDNIEFVPLANKKDSNYIHLSTASNMLVGVNQMGEEEQILVEKHAAFVLQFVATMFFGVQFETLSPERMLVGKLFTE
ncbi:MAG: hypothetical protein IKC70_04330 [Bacteroidaceae bacterium]|nr:hypothetical protein [Bacteroidaceae bacterium]